jgi:very-short-patch-repair endonuclease
LTASRTLNRASWRVIESLGFLVVRVTNVDVYENMEGVLEMIYRTLRPDLDD